MERVRCYHQLTLTEIMENDMKKIKYKVSEGEMIGLLSEGTIFDCYLIHESSDIEGGLMYIPKNIKYTDGNGEEVIDDGCGCLSFAILEDRKCGYYVRYEDNYINLNPKESVKFEEQIKKL